jgi:hypothetical protein
MYETLQVRKSFIHSDDWEELCGLEKGINSSQRGGRDHIMPGFSYILLKEEI